MKVKELIEALKDKDPEMPVLVNAMFAGYREATCNEIVEVNHDKWTDPGHGEFSLCGDEETKFPALYLF